jgi:hypothetical protein
MANENDKVRRAYRQGELLFIPVNGEDMAVLDPEPKSQSNPRWNKLQTNVLREGEATGHKHEVVAQRPDMATILAPVAPLLRGLPNMDLVGSEDRLLVAQAPVEVVHPEHRPLKLAVGIYLMIVQREYDEIKARRIID